LKYGIVRYELRLLTLRYNPGWRACQAGTSFNPYLGLECNRRRQLLMLELEVALSQILSFIPPPVTERVPVTEAHGRIVVEPVRSPIDLPPFSNSAMDGYALQSADIAAAKPGAPVRLRLAGRVAAGSSFHGKVESGACVRLFTGSPMPDGTDAVVMQEDTRTEPGRSGEVIILNSVQPGENLRRRGEDVERGAIVADRGQELTTGRIALLAAVGVKDVAVGRRPLVGVLATGSELREAGQPLEPGQIYESNRAALASLVHRAGGTPNVRPLVTDSLAATCSALNDALDHCDLVVTSGGVSVGEMDFIKPAFVESGGELGFWRVAIKPGRPFVFGRRGNKFLFGLPGNPASALVTFLLLVRPALRHWQGAAEVALPSHAGVLAEPLANPGDRRHFVRVTVSPAGEVRSAGAQLSHAISSFAAANGLVDVPPQTTMPEGRTVQVMRWD
jgi:molybdopterin molybdotransferase